MNTFNFRYTNLRINSSWICSPSKENLIVGFKKQQNPQTPSCMDQKNKRDDMKHRVTSTQKQATEEVKEVKEERSEG